jgi:hypothetical protein
MSVRPSLIMLGMAGISLLLGCAGPLRPSQVVIDCQAQKGIHKFIVAPPSEAAEACADVESKAAEQQAPPPAYPPAQAYRPGYSPLLVQQQQAPPPAYTSAPPPVAQVQPAALPPPPKPQGPLVPNAPAKARCCERSSHRRENCCGTGIW